MTQIIWYETIDKTIGYTNHCMILNHCWYIFGLHLHWSTSRWHCTGLAAGMAGSPKTRGAAGAGETPSFPSWEILSIGCSKMLRNLYSHKLIRHCECNHLSQLLSELLSQQLLLHLLLQYSNSYNQSYDNLLLQINLSDDHEWIETDSITNWRWWSFIHDRVQSNVSWWHRSMIFFCTNAAQIDELQYLWITRTSMNKCALVNWFGCVPSILYSEIIIIFWIPHRGVIDPEWVDATLSNQN